MKELRGVFKSVTLPKNWLVVLLISGAIYGFSEWMWLHDSYSHGVLSAIVPFGVVNFIPTVINDLSLPLLLWGWVLFASRLASKFKRENDALTAESRFGRGLQRLESWVFICLAYFLSYWIPAFVLADNYWSSLLFIILIMQFPLHMSLRFLKIARSKMNDRFPTSRGKLESVLFLFSEIKRSLLKAKKYFFSPSSPNSSEWE